MHSRLRSAHAAKDQPVIDRDIGLAREREGWMPRRELEGRGDLALLRAVAHERAVPARPEREREGVEKDRFSGAGLARQGRKAAREVDVEPVDQDDVANRQAGQHGRNVVRR